MNRIVPQQLLNQITYNTTSTLSVTEVANKIPDACVQYKFSVLHSFNFPEILQGKGFDLKRNVQVFEICRADLAHKMLSEHPEFSIFMPCRIAVFEQDGQTILSTMNMELLLQMIQNDVELYKKGIELFDGLKQMMASLQ